jgi:uncharacterized LabA/DUF88 family protein
VEKNEMLTTYLFIDGGHLREGFKTWASRCYGTEVQPEISQARFALQAIGITGGLEKCFYYDCVDERKNEAESPEEFKHRVAAQEELFNSIRRVPGWHVPEGRLVGSRKQSRQKRVDVLLTVEMLSHAFNKNMGHAILIAGDDDFTPLVSELLRHGTYVTVVSDRLRGWSHLLQAADAGGHMGFRFYWSLAPRAFQDAHSSPSRAENVLHSRPGSAVKCGVLSNGISVEIYDSGSRFQLVTRDGSGPWISRLVGEDSRVLIEYAKDECPDLNPKEWL